MATLDSKTPTPLRIAIIGLSASAITSWAADAHLPALLHPSGRARYIITALCNSSVDAAKAAIKAFDLPPETKAYGNPADLAADDDIDVVICNTRVDRHFETIVDSVRKGKHVYVEWPVTENLERCEELLEVMRKAGGKVAVGLQGRWAPPVLKLKGLVEEGGLGRVLSCEVRAFGGLMDRQRMSTGLKYFGQWSVGGNPITIGFAHMVDFVQATVGDFVEGSTYAKTQIQFPENYALDSKTKEIVETFQSDVPDLFTVTGTIAPSPHVVENATLSVRFRRGQPFKGEPSLQWTINCERGEIRFISPSGASLQADAYGQEQSLQIYRFANDTVEDDMWVWDEEQNQVPVKARTIMKALYAFADGDETGYTSLESAAVRARQIDAWVKNGKW